MEAAARGLEPLKVPKGRFESLQKSLLGLHGGSDGSCSEGFGAFEGAKRQFRKPKKACWHSGGLGRCRRSFLGLRGGCLGAAVAEAAARGLEPLKGSKGSFQSLQKSLLGLHGGSTWETPVPAKNL